MSYWHRRSSAASRRATTIWCASPSLVPSNRRNTTGRSDGHNCAFSSRSSSAWLLRAASRRGERFRASPLLSCCCRRRHGLPVIHTPDGPGAQAPCKARLQVSGLTAAGATARIGPAAVVQVFVLSILQQVRPSLLVPTVHCSRSLSAFEEVRQGRLHVCCVCV